jgi:hypothetical protein
VLAGAAVVLAERHEGLRFPCKRGNEVSVRSFFAFHPEIEVFCVDDPHDLEIKFERQAAARNVIFSGYYAEPNARPGESFDRWFYRQLGVPLEDRWDKSPLLKASKAVEQRLSPCMPHAFLHDDGARGYRIRRDVDPVLAPVRSYFGPTRSILSYRNLIGQADEVHVINSAFWHLTESLVPSTDKLFLHRYARPWSPLDMAKTRLSWEVIDAP